MHSTITRSLVPFNIDVGMLAAIGEDYRRTMRESSVAGKWYATQYD
jgi:hypothetical protein